MPEPISTAQGTRSKHGIALFILSSHSSFVPRPCAAAAAAPAASLASAAAAAAAAAARTAASRRGAFVGCFFAMSARASSESPRQRASSDLPCVRRARGCYPFGRAPGRAGAAPLPEIETGYSASVRETSGAWPAAIADAPP
jgi:hypothetical protein